MVSFYFETFYQYWDHIPNRCAKHRRRCTHTHTHARRRSVWYSNSLDYLNLCDIFTTENETVASARTLPASAVLSGGRCHLRRQTNTHAQRQLHCVRARSQNAHGALIRICCECTDADGARTARTSRQSNHPQSALDALRQPAVERDGRKLASQIWRKVVPGVPFHDRNRITHSPREQDGRKLHLVPVATTGRKRQFFSTHKNIK